MGISCKFLFGAGISLYKMQEMSNTTVIKPFVDDVNCIGSIFQDKFYCLNSNGWRIRSPFSSSNII